MYVCSSCGDEQLRWSGKCASCGEWGTIREEQKVQQGGSGKGAPRTAPPATKVALSKITKPRDTRISLGDTEIDRVLGGGVVPGEVVLLAGEPGIGKSTLLLQVAMNVGGGRSVLYVSGEESLSQLGSRMKRLSGAGKKSVSDAAAKNVSVTDNTDIDTVISLIDEDKPGIVILDSIQAVSTSDASGFPGSIGQVRECGMRIAHAAKKHGIPLIIVGQVTKEGSIAGPKVLEHVVDAVVYFEGDDMGLYRVLRTVKNRFGSTDEVGIFEMTDKGLIGVDDPARVFESGGRLQPGSAISAIFKGSRTIFIEIQALTSPAVFGAPRRLPTGLSKQRLEMLCAVLSRRAGISLGGDDVFVNVLGGMKVDDPAVDLAVCMAVVSAKKDISLKRSDVFVGEVGLSGDVRGTPFLSKMSAEANRRKLSIIAQKDRKRMLIRDVVKYYAK